MKKICVAILLLLAVSLPAAQNTASDADHRIGEALTIIEKEFLKTMTREELIDRALHAFLKDLDPYSSYLNPAEWSAFDRRMSAEFGGIGVNIDNDKESGFPRVGRFLIGSAAAAAGVRRGDLIVDVDGHSMAGKTVDDLVPLLIGEPGSTVNVTFRRDGEPFKVALQRRIVKTPSVRGVRRDRDGTSEYLYDERRGIGYIRVMRLAKDTVAETERALTNLKSRNAKALILDLRDGEGGMMMAAVGVADLLLDRGTILSEVSRTETKVYEATPGGFTDFPVAVLINKGTASSSEFLAAALQDNQRAVLVGQRTFGKGRIQKKFSLGEGLGGVILTTAFFQRPSGKIVDRNDATDAESAGVAPDEGMDLVVEGKEYEAWAEEAFLRDSPVILEDADFGAPQPDRILDRAVEVLTAALRHE